MFTDNDKMPYGSKKGQRLGDISNGFLETLYRNQKDKLPQDLKQYIEDRINILRFERDKKDRNKK